MIEKVVFLRQAPFNERDYKKLGIEILIANGFETWVWDFTPFLYPDIYDLVKPPDPSEYEKLIKFRHKSDAIDAIEKAGENTFILSHISYNIATFSIFKAISKNDIPYSVFTSVEPGRDVINRRKGNIAKRAMRITPTEIIGRLRYAFSKIPPTLLGIRPATLILMGGGAKSLSNMKPTVNHTTEVLWIHALDYDIYLNSPGDGQEERKIAVFLDDGGSFHPDNIYQGRKSNLTPDEYYPLLCKFCDYVEEKLGLNVVIAAHPRSHYEKLPDFFHGRRVIRGKTAELVEDSRLVILNCSTSISFPVLYKKPMVFITTDEHEKSIYRGYAKEFASYFRKTPINISRNVIIDTEKEFFIYEEGYAKYRNDFIKVEGTEELPFWQIVANKIKSLDL